MQFRIDSLIIHEQRRELPFMDPSRLHQIIGNLALSRLSSIQNIGLARISSLMHGSNNNQTAAKKKRKGGKVINDVTHTYENDERTSSPNEVNEVNAPRHPPPTILFRLRLTQTVPYFINRVTLLHNSRENAN